MKTFTDLGGVLEPLGRYAIKGDTRWSLSDPSIGWSPEDGYWVAYRSSNHYLLTDGSIMLTFGEQRLSRLYVQKLSDNLEKFSDPKELLVSNYRVRRGPAGLVSVARGVEDVRLFWRPEGWRMIGAFPEHGRVMALGMWVPGKQPVFAAIQGIKGAPDRGWVPAAYGGSEGFDYILPWGRVIREKKVHQTVDIDDLRHFFGGPPVVPLGDGTFLGMPHMVEEDRVRVYTASRMAYIDGKNQRWTHRFIRYSEEGAPVEMSEPFVLETGGVERCSGMVHWGDDLVLTYGRNDVSSFSGKISQRKVVKLLKRV